MITLIPKAIKYFIFAIVMYTIVYTCSYKMNANPITTIIQILIGGGVYFVISLINKDSIFIDILSKLTNISKNMRK